MTKASSKVEPTTEEQAKKAEWLERLNDPYNEKFFFKVPGTDLRGKEKPGQSVSVRIACSIRYNGGTVIKGKWYSGYDVAPPVVPQGYELISDYTGMQLNSSPPHVTMNLVQKGTRHDHPR